MFGSEHTDNEKQSSTWSLIWQWLMARGMESESTIQERIEWSPRTKALLPLYQAFVGVIAGLMFLLGSGLLGANLNAGLDLGLIKVADMLFLGCVVAIIGLLAVRGIMLWTQHLDQWIYWAVGGTVSLLLGLSVLALASETTWSEWQLAGVGLGLALIAPGAALFIRIMADLLDPFGKTSPLERALLPFAQRLLGQEEMDSQPEPPPAAIPWRQAGQVRATSPAPDLSTHVLLTRQEAALLEFLEESEVRGLGRSAWLGKDQPNVYLPHSRLEVTRETFDGLIDLAVHWGFIRKRGPRKTPERVVVAAEAEAIILEEANRRHST